MNYHPAAAAVLLFAALMGVSPAGGALSSAAATQPTATSTALYQPRALRASYSAPTPADIAALPTASWDAVIPGLLPSIAGPAEFSKTSFTLTADSSLYGADLRTPVAVLPKISSIANQPTVVVVSEQKGAWSRILTPARRSLPSQDPNAPAQSAAWIRTDRLIGGAPVTTRVVISLSKLTLDLVDVTSGAVTATFPVAVGAAETASPVGTGFVEARYSDPKNQPEVGVISLTSLHSTAADIPFGPGGLIAIHRYPRSVGAVSHGCFRISESTAANVIAKVQVGSLVTVTP